MRKFTFEEIMKYKNNRYVKKITYTSIIFTDEFKNILLNKTNSTTDVKIILTSIGIEPHILGKNRIRTLVRNYSKQKCESGSMGKVFSEDEKAFLRKNENIVKITNSKIVYSFEFMIKIAKCKSLGSARDIFINNGLRPEIIGEKRINNSFYRWRNIYIKNGEEGLQNVSLGRKKQNEKLKKMTDTEMVKHLRQQNKMLQNELEIVKKYKPSFPQELISPKEVYLIIADTLENGGKINLSRIFKNLHGSTSGYYRYLKSRYMINSKKARLIADIQYIQGSTFKFGYRRVFMILEKYYASNGIEMLINIKQVQKIMKENNLNAKVRRKKPYKNIWNATKEDIVSENKLKRNFKDGSPREILLTDITYLHCSFGTAYLSAIKDSVTNEIVSYVVKDNLGISLSIDAINTLDISNLSEKVYIHSDQGVHYTSKKFRDLLLEKGIGQSMSRRGNCLDNAPMESFFGHFKDEVDYRYSTSLMELQEVIDNYMIYYNYERQQWGLNKMTPNEYRCHLETI